MKCLHVFVGACHGSKEIKSQKLRSINWLNPREGGKLKKAKIVALLAPTPWLISLLVTVMYIRYTVYVAGTSYFIIANRVIKSANYYFLAVWMGLIYLHPLCLSFHNSKMGEKNSAHLTGSMGGINLQNYNETIYVIYLENNILRKVSATKNWRRECKV